MGVGHISIVACMTMGSGGTFALEVLDDELVSRSGRGGERKQ